MALDGPRTHSQPLPERSRKLVDEPSIIIANEIRQSPEFRALHKISDEEAGSIIIDDSITANHAELHVTEGAGRSLNDALDYQPPAQYLPQIHSYHEAAGNLGMHKAVLASQIRQLPTYIPRLSSNPEYNLIFSALNNIDPKASEWVETISTCKTLRATLASWIQEYRNSIQPDHIAALTRILTTAITHISWIETAAGSTDFYNENRDKILSQFTDAFYKLTDEIKKPRQFKKGDVFKLLRSQLVGQSEIKFEFCYLSPKYGELKYLATASISKESFQITKIENLGQHTFNLHVIALLLGTTQALEAVDINAQYKELSKLPAVPPPVFTPQLKASPSAVITSSPPQVAANSVKNIPWWKVASVKVKDLASKLLKPAIGSSSTVKRASLWRTAALAGVMGILGLSGKETHKTVNTQNNNAAQSVITPTQVQARSTIIAPAATAAPTMASASASVHAGLSANKVDHASIQRGLDMALRTQAGQALIHGLYPGQNLDQSQLDYLGHTIAHNVRAGLPSIHTRTNKEVINITDAGRNGGNTRLFEVHLDDSSSSFVQIDLPTLTTVQQHSLEHRLSTPITPRVAPQAPVSTLDSAGSKLAVQSYTEAAPNIVGDALNKLLQADRLKQHEYLRAQENARRQEKRQELRRYFDELHAKAAERRKLQK